MKRPAAKHSRVFCTECGESLQNYWLDDGTSDVKAIIQRMARCKAEGRFHGNFCARLWIAGSDSFQRPRKTTKVSAKKVEALKASIRKKIAARSRPGDRSA
jgi:hypothetical protein